MLFGLALLSRYDGNVLEKGLSIASLAYGGLLGVFLLGLLTRRAKENGAIVGMLFGLAVNVYVWWMGKIAWTWYVTIGATRHFVSVISLVSRCLIPNRRRARPRMQIDDANRRSRPIRDTLYC